MIQISDMEGQYGLATLELQDSYLLKNKFYLYPVAVLPSKYYLS